MTETTRLTITALGHKGEGIAELDGARVYVPLTMPGDVIDARIVGDHASIAAIVAPSAQRVTPFCPHFGSCGGCALQHVAPESYAAFKRGLVEGQLRRAGLDAAVDPLVDARGAGRRRATLHARKTGAGFMVRHSHDVHNLDRCPILVPALNAAPDIARAIFAAIGTSDVALTATDTGLDVAIRAERKGFGDKLIGLLTRFPIARISLNGETIVMARPPELRVGKASVRLPPGSFLQATGAAEQALANIVVAGLAGCRNVADLFCGIGPFALRLAEHTRVHAADSDRHAIAALADAVRGATGLKPIEAKPRDLFRDALNARELRAFDGVVFDPPRAGAEAQARELAASTVAKVVAVSCDAGTFARDAAILVAGGYRLEAVTPVDQFAFSPHVEMVGVFTR